MRLKEIQKNKNSNGLAAWDFYPFSNGKTEKLKYNRLCSTFKKNKDESRRSGAAPLSWKFWKVFQQF